MNFNFDHFNQYEVPSFTLCNPDLTQLYAMGDLFDRQLKLRFNALSELQFTAKSKVTTNINGIEETLSTPYFDLLDYRRIVLVEDLGYFMIVDISEDDNGTIHTKTITAKSLEVELNFKKLSLFKGQYFFYNFIEPAPTLLGKMIAYLPGWTIGEVDAELCILNRGFDVSDKTIYDFLMNEVSQTYQAIFSFDIINKTINAHLAANATTNSDIYISYDNLVESTNIKPITDEICTALNVYGGGNLSIAQVNPLGTPTIYNFDYYKTTSWMSGSLITAVNNWEAKTSASQVTYASTLTLITQNDILLLAKQGELAVLENELLVLTELQKVRIQQGLPIDAVNTQIIAKRAEITAKEAEIVAVETTITGLNDILSGIWTALSFTNTDNFSAAQLVELNNFIIGSTYTNTNFAKYDNSSASFVQQQAQELYDQAQDVLAKVSEPRYTFEVNAINFVFLKEFQTFIDQLELGCVVTIQFRDEDITYPVGHVIYPALLGIDYSYDDPTQFKLTFSNRLRLDDAAFQFSDLFNQSINTGITTTFNSEMWNNFQDNYRDDVSTFMNSQLDASRNAVTSGSNQEITISAAGLRGRQSVGSGNFDPKQFWMINNMLAFTKDNWDTASLALGEILVGPGKGSYGLVADAIFGTLLAGNSLFITNRDSTFSVSGSLVTIINGEMTLTSTKTNSRIFINPEIGIKIQKNTPLVGYEDKFYIDTNGNIIFAGTLSGADGNFTGTIIANSGKIGAWSIDQFGLTDGTNYIYGDGRTRLGMLSINGSEAWFDGNIYARNLLDNVMGWQIQDIIADTITAGTLRGIDIYGAHIHWPGVVMEAGSYSGLSQILADVSVSLISGTSGLLVANNFIKIDSPNTVMIGHPGASGNIFLLGDIQTQDSSGNLGWGNSTDIVVDTPSGSQVLTFINGLLIDPYHYSSSGSGGGINPSAPDVFTMIFAPLGSSANQRHLDCGSNWWFDNVTVDWGDTTTDVLDGGDYVDHQYSGTGPYTITFTPGSNVTQIYIWEIYDNGQGITISIDDQHPIPPNLTSIDVYDLSFNWSVNNDMPSSLTNFSMNSISDFSWTIDANNPIPSGLTRLILSDQTGITGTFSSSYPLSSNFIRLELLNVATVSISADQFAKQHDAQILGNRNGLNQSQVDAILLAIWADKASFTFSYPIIRLSGTNAAPSGTYQAMNPPTTGKEAKYDLINDIPTDGPDMNVFTN